MLILTSELNRWVRPHDKANDVFLLVQQFNLSLGLVHKPYNGRSIKVGPARTKPNLNPATLFALTIMFS